MDNEFLKLEADIDEKLNLVKGELKIIQSQIKKIMCYAWIGAILFSLITNLIDFTFHYFIGN